MGATLDGRVRSSGAVFEAKLMPPWSFSEEAAAEKYAPQLQHNMWVIAARAAVLSVITGGGKWVEIRVPADPLYQHLIITAERKFWRCVENGEPPTLFGVDPPKPRAEAVRIVDMTSSNAWAEFAAVFCGTAQRTAFNAAGAESPEADSNEPAASPVSEADQFRGPSPRNIDKSALALPEPRRVRDREHLRSVAQRACLVCGRQPSDPHHLRFAQSRAMGRKVSDEFTVPLCLGHHRELHQFGDEAEW